MLDIQSLGKKIWVIGGPGSGKTTVSQSLSSSLGYTNFELDSFVWEENWKKSNDKVIRERVIAALATDSWIIDGQYDPVIDILVAACDSIVFLDVNLKTRFWRVLCRSISYCFLKKALWNGNKESWARLFSKNSMPIYVVTSALSEIQKNYDIYDTCRKKGKYTIRMSKKREINTVLERLRSKL